jgi:hypothetical protein
MALFKDFGKTGKDLLSKEFKADENKIEFKTSHRDVDIESNWVSTNKGMLKTEMKLPYESKLEVQCESDGKCTGTFNISDLVPRTTFKAKGCSNNSFLFGAEYKHKVGTATGEVEMTDSGQALLNVSGLYDWKRVKESILFGGSASLLTEEQMRVKEFSVGAGLKTDSYEITTTVSENLEKQTPPVLLFQFFHKIESDLELAAKFTRTFAASPKCTTEMGLRYKINSDTTFGARVNNLSQVGLFFNRKLSAVSSVTPSFDFNMVQPSAPFRFGMSLKLKN